MMSAFGHDCLYYSQDLFTDISRSLIPFCLRPETVKQSSDEDKSCHGDAVTFQQLKTNNVSIRDLLWWNAVIEIIDLYEKYLVLPNLVDVDAYYCNCSVLSRFGKYCQYDMNIDDDEERSLTNLLWFSRLTPPNEEVQNDYFTCYIGIRCETNLFCLDWRQICNGVVDCDRGEDEPVELCAQMESNECDAEKELRCTNGMCIPLSMIADTQGTCLDRSDGSVLYKAGSTTYFSELCFEYPSFECDETNHGWRGFSCNNGQYISYSDLTAKVNKRGQTCANNRHRMYLQRLFSVNDENECWKSMICVSGFDYLYPQINCSRESMVNNIERSCPNQYYFPSNAVVYSFVFFLYSKVDRVKWIDSAGPDYICYKKEYCKTNIFNLSTISKDNLNCLSVNQTIFSWKNFYEYVVHLFSSCYLNASSSVGVNDKMRYKCHLSNTYISIYRVKDKKRDCYFNEDEDMDINLCSLNTSDQFQCLTNPNECIRQAFINDDQYDCLDGSDEYFKTLFDVCNGPTCEFRPWSKRILAEIYQFRELCDNIVNRHLFSMQSNETDETDCDHWPYTCNSPYTKCNQAWNCANGRDEINCAGRSYHTEIQKLLRCKSNEHYCIRLMNNDINATCIDIKRSSDDIIDCIGGTDERLTSICVKNYPLNFKRRFLCLNSSVCINIDQVCDTIVHCPFGDDERICPWLSENNASAFHCKNGLLQSAVRCDLSVVNNQYCPMREHLWFCDLAVESQITPSSPWMTYETYPPLDQQMQSISSEKLDSNQLIVSEERRLSSVDTNSEMWVCNFGHLILSSTSTHRSYCFCPPSYYGDYCQYQSGHLIVLLQIQIAYSMNQATVFRLIIYLLNENNMILSLGEIVYNRYKIVFSSLYNIDLMYDRMANVSLRQRSKSRFVRIDSYIIKETNVQYISSWFFHISFPFLPVNKLVAELFLRNELFRIVNCRTRCGSHGKCMYYANIRHMEYCWCEQGWYGERCQVRSSSDVCSQASCAAHSQCVILNDEKRQTKCICPLGRSGDQCYITYNSCADVRCQNNGTCLPLDQRKGEFHCSCQDGYGGVYCEDIQLYSYVVIDGNITGLSPISAIIPAIIVTFGFQFESRFKQEHRMLFKNIPLPTTLKIRGRGQFGFVKMFYNLSTSFYYAVSICEAPSSRSYINTSVIRRNLCQNVSEIFNETILYEYSYLKRLKLYHLPCQHNHDLRCFFDEYRMCLCTRNHNSDCLFFNHEYGNCDYCQNGGVCLRQNADEDQWNYVCLCSECSYGSLCQFSPGNYFITLDMLVGIEMKTGNISFNQQSTVVHLTLIFLIIILGFSLIFNTLGIFVFSNTKLRQVGCDLYLLNLTIVSEIGLILLFFRFIYTMMVRMYVVENVLLVQIGCISLEYLLRLIPSLFDWLTVCISVERTYTIIKDVHFTKLVATKTLTVSRWMILLVFVLNILTTLHRPFYLILVDEPTIGDEPQGHPWCVLDFHETSWNAYEKVINVLHLIMPLIMNIVSVIFFISHKTKFELTSATRKNKSTRFVVVKEQMLKYKPLLISPIIIILLEIPRSVLTFTLACMDYGWQRYVYLIGYFISFLPLAGVLFIYIIPSPKHKKQFKKVVGKTVRMLLFRRAREE